MKLLKRLEQIDKWAISHTELAFMIKVATVSILFYILLVLVRFLFL
jgi:hypothetical protein